MATHTPGPWKADGAHGVWAKSVAAKGTTLVATAYEHKQARPYLEAKANCVLIAAAPDLADALAAIIPYAESRIEDMEEERDAAKGEDVRDAAAKDWSKAWKAVEAARAALKKAGRQ